MACHGDFILATRLGDEKADTLRLFGKPVDGAVFPD
jgi:hypothetical protein